MDFTELHPITENIAFLEVNIDDAVNEFLNWQQSIIYNKKSSFKATTITHDLKNTLLSLCPLTTVERKRYLFIPTKSKYIAFFDNGHIGTDRTAPTFLGEKLNVRNFFISFDPASEATIFEYYDKLENKISSIREIVVTKENSWRFYQYGKPLPFEKTDRYKNRIIKDRFNKSMLIEYLNAFGINPFDGDFYDCSKGSILINKIDTLFPNIEELSLKEAQNYFR